MKNRVLISLIVMIVTLSLPLAIFAQADIPPETQDVPLDGGVSLLVAAGVGYGIKKVRESRKAKKDADVLSK